MEKTLVYPYKNACLPSDADRLVFIFMYLRQAGTQDAFGQLFGMSQPVANKWIHLLLPILNAALAEVGELPAREKEPLVSLFLSKHIGSELINEGYQSESLSAFKREQRSQIITPYL